MTKFYKKIMFFSKKNKEPLKQVKCSFFSNFGSRCVLFCRKISISCFQLPIWKRKFPSDWAYPGGKRFVAFVVYGVIVIWSQSNVKNSKMMHINWNIISYTCVISFCSLFILFNNRNVYVLTGFSVNKYFIFIEKYTWSTFPII